MTIVNKNSTSHSGLLVTGTGDDIDIDVELIGGRTLRMSAAGDELGAWPIDECHIEPDPDRNGTFRIVVDGDDAVFTPVDPVGFRSLIEYVTGRASPGDGSSPEVPPDRFGADSANAAGSVGDRESAEPPAADDAVAFLFGSSPPPTPPSSHELTEPAPAPSADPDPVDLDPVDLDPVDLDPVDLDPVDLDQVDFEWGELDDIDVTIEPVSARSTPGSPVAEVAEDDDPSALPGESLAVTPTLAAKLEEAERLEAESAGDEMGPDELVPAPDVSSQDGTVERSRFGGSALERLSEAISSVTASSKSTDDADDADYDLGPNNVADEVLNSQRALRDHRLKDAKRTHRLKLAAIAGVVVGLLALIALLAPGAIEFIQNYEGDAAPPPTLAVTETTVLTTPTTLVEETPADTSTSTTLFAGPAGSVFALPAPDFVARWDAAAATVDEVLEFDANPIVGPFEEQFTPYLSFRGEVQPHGPLSGFSLVVDPSGPSEYDRIGIQALGVAVATVDPERSPQGRAALLGELGLNVRAPQLGGINGTVQSDGLQYTLVYDAATALLTLTVVPAG